MKVDHRANAAAKARIMKHPDYFKYSGHLPADTLAQIAADVAASEERVKVVRDAMLKPKKAKKPVEEA